MATKTKIILTYSILCSYGIIADHQCRAMHWGSSAPQPAHQELSPEDALAIQLAFAEDNAQQWQQQPASTTASSSRTADVSSAHRVSNQLQQVTKIPFYSLKDDPMEIDMVRIYLQQDQTPFGRYGRDYDDAFIEKIIFLRNMLADSRTQRRTFSQSFKPLLFLAKDAYATANTRNIRDFINSMYEHVQRDNCLLPTNIDVSIGMPLERFLINYIPFLRKDRFGGIEAGYQDLMRARATDYLGFLPLYYPDTKFVLLSPVEPMLTKQY